MIAQCYQNGIILFKDHLLDGTIAIMEGEEDEIKAIISSKATCAYDGKTLLVPGIFEAKNSKERVDALIEFACCCKSKEIWSKILHNTGDNDELSIDESKRIRAKDLGRKTL